MGLLNTESPLREVPLYFDIYIGVCHPPIVYIMDVEFNEGAIIKILYRREKRKGTERETEWEEVKEKGRAGREREREERKREER